VGPLSEVRGVVGENVGGSERHKMGRGGLKCDKTSLKENSHEEHDRKGKGDFQRTIATLKRMARGTGGGCNRAIEREERRCQWHQAPANKNK